MALMIDLCPLIFIVPKTPFQYECTRDYDCPTDQACISRACVNPCTIEKCARNALCHVENHTPNCRCPQGQIGDPRVECKFPEPRKTSFISPLYIIITIQNLHKAEKVYESISRV